MELTIEHLKLYVGTGLECINVFGDKVELLGLQIGSDSVNNDLWVFKHNGVFMRGYLYQCMPLLYPLSYLTEEMNINGELFVPHDRLSLGILKGYPRKHEGVGVAENRIITNTMTYTDYLQCAKWNIDIYNLIDQKLAIDKTLL